MRQSVLHALVPRHQTAAGGAKASGEPAAGQDFYCRIACKGRIIETFRVEGLLTVKSPSRYFYVDVRMPIEDLFGRHKA